MLVDFQIDQARLGKTFQVELREVQDEAAHWKKLYVQASSKGENGGIGGNEVSVAGEGAGVGDEERRPEAAGAAEAAGGALGVDDRVKLRGELSVLSKTLEEWELKMKEGLERSIEEAGLRMKLEHEV